MFEVRLENLIHIRKRFQGIGDALKTITPKLEARVKGVLQDAFAEVLDAEGQPRWRKLSPYTLREKQRLGYGSKPILERTGRLRRSYIGSSADSVWRSTETSIIFENRLPYAIYHEVGGEWLPARTILKGILEKKRVRHGIRGAIAEAVREQV